MSDLQHKIFDAAMELKDGDSGHFSGYFARFGNVDRVGDVIEPGAFKNLDEFATDGWIGVSHDMHALPVAMIDSVRQDEKGLLVSGRFHSHPAAQACRSVVTERMQAGRAVKCSIGYKTDDSKKDRLDGKSITRLKALRVFEASFVNLAANPAASVIAAKSLDSDGPKIITIDELKGFLEEIDTKAGKTISKTNYNKLKDMHAKLGDAHAMLGSFLNQHDPDGGVDDPDDDDLVGGGGRVAGKAAQINELRLRALRGRTDNAALLRE